MRSLTIALHLVLVDQSRQTLAQQNKILLKVMGRNNYNFDLVLRA